MFPFDLKDVGHTIQVAGVLLNSSNETFALLLPNENFYFQEGGVTICSLSDKEWVQLFWQSDILETEVPTKHGKAIVRKAERQISNFISWNVFRRDEYTCRYCGKNDVPLTVDHVVLWEEGGPSIEDNLVACCRKCNQKRGNLRYKAWLKSDLYKSVSVNLSEKFKVMNEILAEIIDHRPKSYVKLRGKKR